MTEEGKRGADRDVALLSLAQHGVAAMARDARIVSVDQVEESDAEEDDDTDGYVDAVCRGNAVGVRFLQVIP